MQDDIQVPVLLTEDECEFMLEFCDGIIDIDLSLKLSMPRISSQTSIIIRFTNRELSSLICALLQNANGLTSNSSLSNWGHDLAKYLAKQGEKMEAIQ